MHFKIISLILVSQTYLEMGKLDLASTLAFEALYDSSKSAANKTESMHLSRYAFLILAQIAIKEGRFKKALERIEIALHFDVRQTPESEDSIKEILHFLDDNFTLPYAETLLSLIEKTTALPKARIIDVFNNAIIFIEKKNTGRKPDDFVQKIKHAVKCLKHSEPSNLSLDEILQLYEEPYKEEQAILNEKQANNLLRMKDTLSLYTQLYKKEQAVKKAASAKKHRETISALEQTTEQLSDLTLTDTSTSCSTAASSSACSSSTSTESKSKVKLKTRGISNPALSTKREDHTLLREDSPEQEGFTVPPGYCNPIPVEGPYLSRGQIFITMPENDPSFSLFYKLTSGGTIQCRAEHGVHQQGLKFAHAKVQVEPGMPHETVPIARLKVCGGNTLRPWGFIAQKIHSQTKGWSTLYRFDSENIFEKGKERKKGLK